MAQGDLDERGTVYPTGDIIDNLRI